MTPERERDIHSAASAMTHESMAKVRAMLEELLEEVRVERRRADVIETEVIALATQEWWNAELNVSLAEHLAGVRQRINDEIARRRG